MSSLAQIETLLHDALSLPPGVDRRAWIETRCQDRELLEEVLSLLEAHAGMVRTGSEALPQQAIPTAQFGAYRAVELVGRGGMSAVYRASRTDGQFDHTVALKVMAAYLAGPEFLRRFEAERQILASLNHDHITRLLDGGVSSSGDPYLITEYVDGETIDRYCDQRKLDVKARLRIFLQVCAAVNCAHRNLIVHRDLKPHNILVNQESAVKLLDFGTASLLAGANDITVTRLRMLTPRYASPEQLRSQRVDFRTDIFSLGVILYEMLSGAWPFGDPDSVLSGLNRAAGDVPAQSPAKSVTEESAGLRSTSHEQLSRMLKGDLSAIVLKALENDPARRYGSVRELAEDIESFLEGRPVLAHPQTAVYRAGKFVGRRWRAVAAVWREVAVLAAVAIGAAGLWYVWAGRTTSPPSPSIAVLPFANLGGDPANQYFSDGLTDEITGALTRFKTLRVIARSSASEFQDKPGGAREFGRKLGVATVLEGSVARNGDRVRIVARLERVSDGSLVWSNIYERPAADLLAVQSELAEGIAASLKAPASPANSRKHVVTDTEAYDAYILGHFESDHGGPEVYDKAKAHFEHAIERDPQFALAYLELADLEWNQAASRGTGVRTEAERQTSERLYRKALELDPELRGIHSAFATIAMQDDWDWTRAERELQAEIAIGPNEFAELNLAWLDIIQGRMAEADIHLRRSEELDPLGTVSQHNRGLYRIYQGRYPKAREELQRLADMHPDVVIRNAQCWIGLSYILEGRPDLAMPRIRAMIPRFPQAQFYEAMALARAGQRDDALKLIGELEKKYEGGGASRQWFALVYAFLGDRAKTLKWLEKSADQHEWQSLGFAAHPAFVFLHEDPGFLALKKRMGLDR